jgi:hypothetical protein
MVSNVPYPGGRHLRDVDKALDARELVELDIGSIIFDSLHCSHDKVSDFGEDDLRSLGGHWPLLFLAQRL